MGYRNEILQIIHSDGLPVDVPIEFFWKCDPRCDNVGVGDLIGREVSDETTDSQEQNHAGPAVALAQ